MTVEELYERIGGNYQEVLGRLQMDKLVGSFILKFPNDESCQNTINAWKAGDKAAAFDAAHMAKGVCGNLSLKRLTDLTSEVCEALRPGNEALFESTDVDALIADIERIYGETCDAIKEFEQA